MAERLTLTDGRVQEYHISGDPNGFPMFYLHGMPGSYLGPNWLWDACQKKGIKLITLNRAGYGGSTRSKRRKVVDIVADVEQLQKHLGITKCFVGGWSAGGPHALACAARLPGCVAVLSIAAVAPHDAEGLDWIAGQGQDNVDEYHASLKGEPHFHEFCQSIRTEMLAADAKGLVEIMSNLLPDIDKKAMLGDPKVGQDLVNDFQEAFKVGADGYVDDGMAFIEPWGFALDEIRVPVYLWQGSVDLMVPYSHGQWLAKHLPQEKLHAHLLDGEGHGSIFIWRVDDMLDELLSVKSS